MQKYILLIIFSLSSFANDSIYLQDAKSLIKAIESKYAPLEYKIARGLDWEEAKEFIINKAQTATNHSIYHSYVTQFLSKLKDIHVGVSLDSMKSESNPAQFQVVEGQTILTYIDRTQISRSSCPIKIGDKLLKMDNRSPNSLRRTYKKYKDFGKERSNLLMHSLNLTQRYRASGMPVALGIKTTTSISFQSRATGEVQNCTIPLVQKGKSQKTNLKIKPNQLPAHVMKVSVDTNEPKIKKIEPIKPFEGDYISSLKVIPKMKLPTDFKFIPAPKLLENEFMHTWMLAGTFTKNGKKVGLLRIPTYVPTHPQFSTQLTQLVIRYYIHKLQESTDYLILDQTYNTGGLVMMTDFLIGSFVERFDYDNHLTYKASIGADFIESIFYGFQSIAYDSSIPYPVRKEHGIKALNDFYKLLEAEKNNDRLSPPLSLLPTSLAQEELFNNYGYDVIAEVFKDIVKAHNIESMMSFERPKVLIGTSLEEHLGVNLRVKPKYTKPLYILVNEMNFSGGDVLPATLQDYGRATIVGVETGGAGGTVESFKSDLGYNYQLTTSLMVRKDGSLVENNGVTPDIRFEDKISDHLNGFSNYMDRLITAIGE
jgi:hypothetical protein